jgi:excisionase family DNA binding protein
MSRESIAGNRTTTDRQLDELIAVSPVKAAELVGLSRATIYNLIERGELRRSKIGKATRIPVADLVALIERGIA